MMSRFLVNNRQELVERCKAKVALRPRRSATVEQLSNGVPLFLAQLQRTLEAEEGAGDAAESRRISGPSGGTASVISEMSVSAMAHGKQLLELGFSIDQVVHDYGDLCQAITDLAFERDAPFSVDEFRTLNRCLDNAIASAVSAFTSERDAVLARKQDAEVNERVEVLVFELRNAVATATYAVAALEQGNLPIAGSTGAVLKRSLGTLKALMTRSFDAVRARTGAAGTQQAFSVMSFIAEAKSAASLHSPGKGCKLIAPVIDPALQVQGDYSRLMAALDNLLQNAFKFTKPQTEVTLAARAEGGDVLIEVSDHCGGLPAGYATSMFKPFSAQAENDRPGLGLGLGLMIARESVQADGGTLSVQNVPGIGCIFAMRLPRHVQG
jgi:signal transduction histidine kinase